MNVKNLVSCLALNKNLINSRSNYYINRRKVNLDFSMPVYKII